MNTKYSNFEILRMRIADLRGRGVYSGYPNAHRCVFIHIPKAAGTSLTKTLFAAPSRHLHYTEYQRTNPRKFQQYFKFTFVRNPFDRLYSAYTFLKKGGLNELDREWAQQNLASFPDFESFVHGWVSPENIQTWTHFKPQHHWICDASFNLKVDFVGRFERMDEDVAVVQARLGMPVARLPKINVTIRPRTKEDPYTAEMRAIVGEVYRNDFELFSYKD
jgi:hypothetical protein